VGFETSTVGFMAKKIIPATVNTSKGASFRMVNISLAFPACFTPTIFITVKKKDEDYLDGYL